ncbi:MAG: ATP-binding protein [Vulcanimicrobiaceae bacterium]
MAFVAMASVDSRHRQLAYPNEPESVGLARRMVEDFAYENGVRGAALSDLTSAVGEALTNAAQHGYRPQTSITVRCLADVEQIAVEVEDQGPGFAPAPSLDDKKRESPGNGLTIMFCLVDRVSFEKNGRVIRLEKRLS